MAKLLWSDTYLIPKSLFTNDTTKIRVAAKRKTDKSCTVLRELRLSLLFPSLTPITDVTSAYNVATRLIYINDVPISAIN